MNRRKPKQYVCLSQAPIFSGKENEEIIEDIKNFSLYENITSKYSKDDQVRLFSVKRKGIMFYPKIWVIPAPEHAIVATRLRGEI